MNPSEKKLADIRQEYALASLRKSDLSVDPIVQFQTWFQEAINAEINDVNAMTLATVDVNLRPHARIVLLKGVEQESFIFFTNYKSHKGLEMGINPNIALVFYWKELQRQVRIEGSVEKISDQASIEYFHSRPLESQLGALASHQSEVLDNREELEQRFAALKLQYQDKQIPKPAHWGGYAVKPDMIEFWQGRASRMHDRFRYQLQENNTWKIDRLNP